MSVKYSWNRQNGAAMPSVRFMSIEPAENYYKGMPLRLKEEGIVEPTDGDPEYICMAEYNPGAEIQPLEIPVQEVFPDVVYDRMNDDGSIEEVRFGSKGGDVLNENGKLKNEVLPDGYPYETEGLVEIIPEQTVTTFDDNGSAYIAVLEIDDISNNLEFNEQITVYYDGVKYECNAIVTPQFVLFGDLSLSGMGEGGEEYPFLFHLYNEPSAPKFLITKDTAPTTHTFAVFKNGTIIVPMDEKFLPEGIGGGGDSKPSLVVDANTKKYTCDIDIVDFITKAKNEGPDAVNVKVKDAMIDRIITASTYIRLWYAFFSQSIDGNNNNAPISVLKYCYVDVESDGTVTTKDLYKFVGSVL